MTTHRPNQYSTGSIVRLLSVTCALFACSLAPTAKCFAATTLVSSNVYQVDEGVQFTLGNNGSSDFLFNWADPGSPVQSVSHASDPTLILTIGQTYTFQRITSAHPFVIMDDAAASFISGADGSYVRTTTDGTLIDAATLTPVTDFTADPAPTTDIITWTPTTAGTFWYTCRVTSHAGMSGAIMVVPAPPTAYSEDEAGDLSGAFADPTQIYVSPGTNRIVGQFGRNGNDGATNGQDADYFRIDVAYGLQLSSVTVDSYVFSPGDPGSSFAAYTAGDAFTGQGAEDIDGQVLFNASSGEVLDDLAGGPLGAGTYAFWLQETSANVVDYEISFTLAREESAFISRFSADVFDATSEGWKIGGAGTQPSWNSGTSIDGQSGFLRHVSDASGSNGKWLMWSDEPNWRGNYFFAGVGAVAMWVDNRAGNPLALRIAFDGPGGWFYSSARAVTNSTGGDDWVRLVFRLDRSNFTYVAGSGGSGQFADTLSNVSRFEILGGNAAITYNARGDIIDAGTSANTLWIDNIVGLPVESSFVAIRPLSATDVELVFTGQEGFPYVLSRGTNLREWVTPSGTNVFSGGANYYTDTIGTEPVHVYRLVQP